MAGPPQAPGGPAGPAARAAPAPAALSLMLALAAGPSLVFALLVGLGRLAFLPGLLGWAGCTAAAFWLGLLLGRDIAAIAAMAARWESAPASLPEIRLAMPGLRALRQAAAGLPRAGPPGPSPPPVPAADMALLERLPDPLLRLDENGAIGWRNASAAAAFGTDNAALLRHPDLRQALAAARTGLAPLRQSIVLAAPVLRDLDVTLIPTGNPAPGGPIYLLVTDRTRERSVEKMRADFVANASHELRTPLASLIGFIETLRGPAANDPEAQRRFLEIMAEQAMRMQRVIADLLSLSRIEINEHRPPGEVLRLPPLLEQVVAAMEPMLRDSGTRIEAEIAADLPAVPADADQLTQVFTNLLDNAIKYGRRGGRITLTAGPSEGDPRFESAGVLIAVTDDGQGIAREHIPRLTERFYRVDKGRSRAVGGTGLGLAIVKHVVNRHRGRLLIESRPGQGTSFLVWLPLPRR